jgi:hypothetical protein
MALRDGIGPVVLAAALLLQVGAAEAQLAGRANGRVEVELGVADRRIVMQPGMSDIIPLPRPARTVIVGDPKVADATLNGDQSLVLTGLPGSGGETNLIILGQDNNEILRAVVRIGPPRAHKIEVSSGLETQSYSCQPGCRPDPTATTTATRYSTPFGTTTAVTTTGNLPPELLTPPGPAPATAPPAPPR